jgi:hypothetical protein
MTMTRRILIAVLAAGIALSVPGVIATASAQPMHHGDSSSASAFWSTATPTQKSTVQGARQQYLKDVWGARRTLEKQVAAIRADMRATLDPQEQALWLAKDALAFATATGGDVAGAQAAYDKAKADYRTAAEAARATAKTAYDKAWADAKAVFDKAGADYRATVTAAFTAGTVIPESVLTPPGGRGWMQGMAGHSKDWGMSFGHR